MGASTVVADGWGWHFGANPSLGIAGGSFTIAPGERVLLLGPSGCGKSTLLRALAGVLGDDEGVQTGSLSLSGEAPGASRGQVGLVLQDPHTQAVLSRVGDDVAFGCENLGVSVDETWVRVHESLEMVGLHVPLSHSTSHLSGGQKQRLALAGALAMQPELLLLDEPTANLDPAGALAVRDYVLHVTKQTGATLIVVDHNVDLWWNQVDRILVMNQLGQIVADGAPQRVIADSATQLAGYGIWLPDWRNPFTSCHHGAEHAGEKVVRASDLQLARSVSQKINHQLNFEVGAGEFLVVTGENGAGKTTLALTVGGLIPPASGALTVNLREGVRGEERPYKWSSAQLATRIGSVFQSPEMQFVAHTVRAELLHGAKLTNATKPAAEAEVDVMLERMGLHNHAQAHPFMLSGGQQRRLAVASALIAKPQLLVLDEPTFAQDANTWVEIVSILDELTRAGHSIIAATHDSRLASLGSQRLELSLSEVATR